jgi:hypothetical protein
VSPPFPIRQPPEADFRLVALVLLADGPVGTYFPSSPLDDISAQMPAAQPPFTGSCMANGRMAINAHRCQGIRFLPRPISEKADINGGTMVRLAPNALTRKPHAVFCHIELDGHHCDCPTFCTQSSGNWVCGKQGGNVENMDTKQSWQDTPWMRATFPP